MLENNSFYQVLCIFEPPDYICPNCGESAVRPDHKRACGAFTVNPTHCVHRGAVVREQVCETCESKPRMPICTCAIHGECSMFLLATGVQLCRYCKDVTLPPAEPPVPKPDPPRTLRPL